MLEERYKSTLLECFAKAKELRMMHWQDCVTAREQGKLLISSSLVAEPALFAGLGDFVYWAGEMYGSNVGNNKDWAREAQEASEARGFARDMCGYCRNDLGSMFLDRFLYGGGYPRPDFVLTSHDCEPRARWWQVIAEHFKVPFFVYEHPLRPYESGGEHKTEYLASQLHDAIEWMESVTKKKYDDEKFIQAVRNTFRCHKLWAEVALLNAAIPAPLALRWMFSLQAIPHLWRHKEEGVKFLEALRDEVLYRVENGIAALATERCRLMLDSMPPWVALHVFRWVQETFGAVWVGVWVYTVTNGIFDELKDGTLVPGRTPEERGWPLKTREDAVWALAKCHEGNFRYTRMYDVGGKAADIVQLAKQWRVDGVVLHLNRACPGSCIGITGAKIAIRKAGIPVTSFEASGADPREVNEVEIKDTLEVFMNNLGLMGVGA